MSTLNFFLYFLSGILLNMGLVHLVNFTETKRHLMLAKLKFPKLVSTLGGLGYLFFGVLILLLLDYKFGLQLSTAFIFLGFSFWAILIGIWAEQADRKEKND